MEALMKYFPIGLMAPMFFGKTVYAYTASAVPELDIKAFKKEHLKEYKAMIKRTPSIGSPKENIFAPVMYLACYLFSYYKADPKKITMDVFDGMVNAVCYNERMKKMYKNKSCFDSKKMERYRQGALRSQKKEYPMDWVFEFSFNPDVPEYYITHRQCGVCMIGKQENLSFLLPHMCVMDYPTIEFSGGKLLRTKTLGNGDDCCDFHVVKAE